MGMVYNDIPVYPAILQDLLICKLSIIIHQIKNLILVQFFPGIFHIQILIQVIKLYLNMIFLTDFCDRCTQKNR